MKAILLIFMAMLLADSASAQVGRLPPRDACAQDASFRAFRSELEAAVAAKDADRLLSLTADDIEFSFGDGAGKADFIANWELARPRHSAIWAHLAEALRLGCAPTGDYLGAPSMFIDFPEMLDAFEHVVAVGTRIPVHAQPSADSKLLARLDWQILPTLDDEGGDWVKVRLADGRPAYVKRAHVRSPLDYRAIFQKRDDRWLMTAFVAGD